MLSDILGDVVCIARSEMLQDARNENIKTVTCKLPKEGFMGDQKLTLKNAANNQMLSHPI